MTKSEMQWTDPETGRPWSVNFEWRTINGRKECVGIGILAEDLPREKPRVLTATGLRALPWGVLIHEGRLDAIRGQQAASADFRKRGETHKAERSERFARGLERPKLRRDGRPKWWTDEHYQAVADVYADALERGDAPTKAVHEAWPMVAYTTAARWVRVCRDRGLLAPAPQQGVPAGRQESEGGQS